MPTDNDWERMLPALSHMLAPTDTPDQYFHEPSLLREVPSMTTGASGNAGAQLNLGLMYYNGQGVPQDYAESYKWYRLAA